MILAAAAIAMPSQAQKKVNLNKGDVKRPWSLTMATT